MATWTDICAGRPRWSRAGASTSRSTDYCPKISISRSSLPRASLSRSDEWAARRACSLVRPRAPRPKWVTRRRFWDRELHVRFPLESRHAKSPPPCPLSAISRLAVDLCTLEIMLLLTVRDPFATVETLLGRALEPASPIGCSLLGGASPSRSDPPIELRDDLLPELSHSRQRCCEGTVARRKVCYLKCAGSQ